MPAGPWKARPPSPLAVWRIASARHAGHLFDGEGARLYGGRWNHAGTPAVYASFTLSLSALEFFVHLEPDLAPADLVAASAAIPSDIPVQEVAVADLPMDWRTYPAPESLKDLGTQWLHSRESAVLVVPSCVIPRESNVMLNPAHADFPRILLASPESFAFDPRMWK